MSDSRTKKALSNIVANFFNQIITLLLNFVSRTVFIHTLGVEFLGLNGLFNDILYMLSMADLGFSTAMVYSLYKPIAEKDNKKIAALLSFYKKAYNTIAMIVLVIGLCLTPFVPYIVNTENDIPLIKVYYIFALAGVVVSYLFVYRTSIITADQKNYIITKITMFVSITRTLCQIVILVLFENYILYLVLGLVFNVFSNLLASNKAVKMYPYIKEKELLEKSEIKDIFTNIKSIFIYKLSSVLLNATDNIIISVLFGTIMVGYYSNYQMISTKLTQIIALVFTSVTASVGHVIVTEKEKKRYEVFSIEQTASFVICGVAVPCFFVLINDLIKVWLGEDFSLGIGMAFAASVNLYLSCVLQPLWSYREATGLYRKTKWIMLIAAMANCVLSIVLGRLIGIVGVILASGIARMVTYVWYEPRLLFREYFAKSSFGYFKDIILNSVLVVLVSGLLIYLSREMIVTNWLTLIGKSAFCVMVSTLVFGVVYFRTQQVKLLLERIRREG